MEPISLLLPSGTSPPVFSSTTIGWFGFLCITPIILTPLIRRALKISQEDALLAAYNLTALSPTFAFAATAMHGSLRTSPPSAAHAMIGYMVITFCCDVIFRSNAH